MSRAAAGDVDGAMSRVRTTAGVRYRRCAASTVRGIEGALYDSALYDSAVLMAARYDSAVLMAVRRR